MRPRESLAGEREAALFALGVVTILNFLNYIDRFILAAVLPRVKSELVLTDFQLGLLANVFLVTYFVTSPLFGALGDRLSRPRLMSAGVTVWSMATAAAGFTADFVQLLIARAWVGIGEAAYATISPALLSDYFPRSQRGRAFAVFYVAIPVGSAAGFLLGGTLERAFGWRAAFYAVGWPGIVLALLALRVPDPVRGATEEPSSLGSGRRDSPRSASPSGRSLEERADAPGEGFSTRNTLSDLFRNKAYVGTVLGYAAYTFALGGLAFFMPTYFERVRGLELARADFTVGGVTVLAGLSGTFLGGYLGDWIAARVKYGQLWLSGLSSIAGMAGAHRRIFADLYRVVFFGGVPSFPQHRTRECDDCERCTTSRARAVDGGEHFHDSLIRRCNLSANHWMAGRHSRPCPCRFDRTRCYRDFRFRLDGDSANS